MAAIAWTCDLPAAAQAQGTLAAPPGDAAPEGPADAEPVGPPAGPSGAEAVARGHFRRGLAHYRAGDYRAAIVAFAAADRALPSASHAYNIGRAQEELGQLALAIEAFELYLARAPNASDAAAVAERVHWLSEVSAALDGLGGGTREQGLLKLDLPEDAGALTLFVDGHLLGRPGTAGVVPLPAGRHRLLVRRESGDAFTSDVEVRPGAVTEVNVLLAPLEPVRAEATGPSGAVMVLAGLGGAALATGAGVGLASQGRGVDDAVTVTQVSWGAGAVMLAVAAVLAALE